MSKKDIVDRYLGDNGFLDYLGSHGVSLLSSVDILYRAAIEYYTLRYPSVTL